MKILKMFNGFVTNSSSVNFLIASREELTEEMLREHLGDYTAKYLWDNISYDRKSEVKPYEFDFYEFTIGKGSFHYYPGSFPDDDFDAPPIQGKMIDEKNFILCVGFFEQWTDWQKKSMQKKSMQSVRIGNRKRNMYGVNLWLSGYGIQNIKEIKGLNKLENLMVLDLNNNKIKEIQGLEELTDLRILKLGHNQIDKIQGLESLINLESLYLHDNPIKEIEGLENLTKLDYLSLNNTNIPKSLIEQLGGIPLIEQLEGIPKSLIGHFNVKEPQKFVEYCKKKTE